MHKDCRTKLSGKWLCVLAIILFPLSGEPQTMLWEGNFSSITLDNLTHTASEVEGSASVTLTLTGDVELQADNTSSARLTNEGGGNLITEYGLHFDGDGSTATGASSVDYQSYTDFINSPLRLTHVGADDEVRVTLKVRARQHTGTASDVGVYRATQVLTAVWTGP